MENKIDLEEQARASATRRDFLRWSGGTMAAAALILQGCAKDAALPTNMDEANKGRPAVNLGKGDIGILNYAYALEQLEAAFYSAVVTAPGFATAFANAYERRLMTDIRDHEVAHRNFFKAVLGNKAIRDLTVDFSSIDFSSRDNVLAVAKTFEDLGVAAYNGAAELIANPDYLLIAGKIVSVEARHAAFIRDRIQNGSFADSTVVDMNGLDKALMPAQVLQIVEGSGYVKNRFLYQGLPTS